MDALRAEQDGGPAISQGAGETLPTDHEHLDPSWRC